MSETLVLNAKLDLSVASSLHAQLAPLCDDDLVLDAAEVSHMGALCTQILIAAGRKAKTGGHRFKMVNASDRVLAQMAAMGLSPENIMGENE